MAVLKHTSPTASPTAPTPIPCQIVPSASARTPVAPLTRAGDKRAGESLRRGTRPLASHRPEGRQRGACHTARGSLVFEQGGDLHAACERDHPWGGLGRPP